MNEQSIVRVMRTILGGEQKSTPADDVVYAALTKDMVVVANVDTLVQSTDVPPGMSLRQAARKSVVACVSDFAAKGARPIFGVVSVTLPKTIQYGQVQQIAKGLRQAADEYHIQILGGDTNAGPETALSVCLLGRQEVRRRVRRGGARHGDLIFVTGPFGYTTLGLESLLSRRPVAGVLGRSAIRAVVHPEARLEFGLECARYFSSSMDSSDGLAATLGEMTEKSRAIFEIVKTPTTEQVTRYVTRHGLDLKKIVFDGGEEYEIVFTVPQKYKKSIIQCAADLKVPVIEIGRVLEDHGRAAGAYLAVQGFDCTRIDRHGWDHFQ